MKTEKFYAFSGVILSVGFLIFSLFALLDPYFVSSIVTDSGEQSRGTAFYGSEGSFALEAHGSANFYNSIMLSCESRDKKAFSLGDFVSDAKGLLQETEVKGYLKSSSGSSVDCRFWSHNEIAVYSVFRSLTSSATLFVLFVVLLLFSIIIFVYSVFELLSNN